MSCCWKWVEGFYKSESDITKDLLENEEPCDVVASEQVMGREEEALSGKEVHFAIVEEHPTTVEEHPTTVEEHPTTVDEEHPTTVEEHPTTVEEDPTTVEEDPTTLEEHHIDGVIGEDGTGSDTETEIDYDDDIFEEADSDYEQLPEQQELYSVRGELALLEEMDGEVDISVNSSNAETIAMLKQ